MDLIVWVEDDGGPCGLQLTYDSGESGQGMKVLTWLPESGYSHDSLDEGEDRPFRYKMTPVAVPDGVFNQEEVLDRFLKESEEIDSDVREFVAGKLREYPL
ncbi:MAG: hypothetical protein KAR83_00465 [Thermodesulfovibrionales bacterium]|nr:hypothetical protein [Thermodesulfovibrionales bacterium]